MQQIALDNSEDWFTGHNCNIWLKQVGIAINGAIDNHYQKTRWYPEEEVERGCDKALMDNGSCLIKVRD